jgi:hypothetical protein
MTIALASVVSAAGSRDRRVVILRLLMSLLFES